MREVAFLLVVLAACGGSAAGGNRSGASGASGASGGNGACPVLAGSYHLMVTRGSCGNLYGSDNPCISQANCEATFRSTPLFGGDGGPSAVNGVVHLASDGSFSGASLSLGAQPHTDCVGSWDPGSSTEKISCGGADASDSCSVTLVRFATACH